jgi:hypothetical protein
VFKGTVLYFVTCAMHVAEKSKDSPFVHEADADHNNSLVSEEKWSAKIPEFDRQMMTLLPRTPCKNISRECESRTSKHSRHFAGGARSQDEKRSPRYYFIPSVRQLAAALQRLQADVDAGTVDAQVKLSQFKTERRALAEELEAVSVVCVCPDLDCSNHSSWRMLYRHGVKRSSTGSTTQNAKTTAVPWTREHSL